MAGEPPWWYSTRRSPMARVLAPFSAVYGQMVERRIATTIPYKSKLPVICVGNFTAGGTGKTPFTQMLIPFLEARGARPAILTRGYGGSERGPLWVERGVHTSARVGDEPLLLAASAPVMVARDRAAGAQAIERDARNFTVIVMDDGMQNPSLAKTLSLALVDGARGFGNGEVIPSGPLRAPLEAQMARVDAIIVNSGQHDSATTDIGQTLMRTFTGPVLEAHVVPEFDPASVGKAPVIAFAGIGVPQRFFALLDRFGLNMRSQLAFGDHHAFTERQAQGLLDDAAVGGAVLLTTEKDLARLSGLDGARGKLAAVARAVPIRLHLANRDQERLAALIDPLL